MELKKGLSILVLVAALLAVNIFTFFTIPSITGETTGDTSGTVDLCIMKPPEITAIADQTATAGTAFTLQVQTTFYGSNSNINYFDDTSLFNINGSGYISFTPAAASVGTHDILITAQDSSSCDIALNDSDSFVLTIQAGGAGEGGGGAGGGGGGGGGGIQRYILVDLDTNIQQTVSILKNSRFTIKYQQQEFGVRVPKATQNEVVIAVPGNTYSIPMEQRLGIDITQDGRSDVNVRYASLKGNIVTLTLSRIIRDSLPTFNEPSQPLQNPKDIIEKERSPEILQQLSFFSTLWFRILLVLFVLVISFYLRFRIR